MVSNAIVYDPLLVRYLSRELNERLRGRACTAVPIFTSERSAVLPLDRDEALLLDLHPLRGWVRLVPWDSGEEELDAVCEGVEAPQDERLLVLRIHAGDRFRALSRRLVVELHSNQWNALLVSDEDDRILSALWSRTAGGRALHSGQRYQAPVAAPRFGEGDPLEVEARAEWWTRIGNTEPKARRRALLAGFAYTGTANAGPVLGSASREADAGALWSAFARWWWLRSLPPAHPVILHLPDRRLPYPVPLQGVESEPAKSLLAAMGTLAEAFGAAAEAATPAAGVAAITRRLEGAQRRKEQLERELARSGEAERMRLWGDLLLARKRLVPRGAERVRLQNWDGSLEEVTLDPMLSAAENATRWYDEARKRARADERIPGLLEEAATEVERWRQALEGAERGELPTWVEDALGAGRPEGPAAGGEAGAGRPYRRYRTSGGLEVRVGKSARDNDQLTFGHSSPNDVWLHARSVAGSHVILRWQDDATPPARDLAEAATLAALYSKARSSSMVPVDWTRRKYVRKPRGAPPGSVVPQRVRTLFVEPDDAEEERLRVD